MKPNKIIIPITVEDTINAMIKEYRNSYYNFNCGWKQSRQVHKNKKNYNRKLKHKHNDN